MKIRFNNSNGSYTIISGKTQQQIFNKYFHKYNRHISSKKYPQFILTNISQFADFNISFTIIK